MPLDSDVSNADAQLHVEFYEHDKAGPWRGKPFVRIVVPGDKTNVIDQPVREDHKQRFPRQWLFYQMKSHENAPAIGTPLSQWRTDRPNELTDGQLTELTILKFQSVEQVAQASDGQIMRVGMGAVGIRERARAYISSKNAFAAGAELNEAKAQIAALTEMVNKLASGATVVAPKVRRGGWKKGVKRPRKDKNVHNDAATASPASS